MYNLCRGNVSENVGSSNPKFWEGLSSSETTKIIKDIFNLGDNDVLNLLELLKLLSDLQLLFITLVLYYFILINISNETIKYYITKFLGNSKYVLKYVEVLQNFKKTGFIIIFFLLLLLVFSHLLFNHYFIS